MRRTVLAVLTLVLAAAPLAAQDPHFGLGLVLGFPTGALNGTVALTAAAGELDGVDLVQTFSFAGVPASFVVQSAPVVLPVVTPTPPSAAPLSRAAFSAASPATFAFPVAPPGTYQAVLNRYTYSSLNGISLQRTPTAPFRIKAGEVTVITF